MSTIKRIAKLEAGNKLKISWREFIGMDTWPDGKVPPGLENVPETPQPEPSEYERKFKVRQ